ncbi:MAG: type II toxin-antitoxin system Phd/YefM family antitoxin [Deltaproteobacteria bacterium]|nr:type II toxin-antitoxin system Phd/YefM family antitoxin [Deltaproteobacteria bacterium]
MKNIRVSKNIIPVSEFKARAAEWLRRLGDRSEPLIITQNGKAAAVVLSPAAFDELTDRHRFIEAVEEGLADAEAGRITTHDTLVAEIHRRYDAVDDE